MRFAILVVALGLAAGVNAQVLDTKRLIGVKADGKWGVLDQRGAPVLPLEYDSVLIRDDGLISARRGKEYKYFDASGQNVWAGYESVSEPDINGYRSVQGKDRRTGLVGQDGRQLLPPVFGYIHPFDKNGHYVVHHRGRAIVIGLDGKPLFQRDFFYISKLAENGLAVAKPDLRSYGIIDRSGEWVIPPGQFEEIQEFGADGLASAKSGGKWGFINRAGQWVVKPISEDLLWMWPFNDHGTTPAKIDGKWGLIDRSGKIVAKPQFDQIGLYKDGSYTAEIGGKKGLLDSRGRWLLKPNFTNFTAFHEEGLAAAWQGAKSFVIDRKGRSVFGDRFERVGGFFGGGWAAAQAGGKWGAINTSGNWILKPQYQCVSICFDDMPPPVFTPLPLVD